jgi:hypothetical protein
MPASALSRSHPDLVEAFKRASRCGECVRGSRTQRFIPGERGKTSVGFTIPDQVRMLWVALGLDGSHRLQAAFERALKCTL